MGLPKKETKGEKKAKKDKTNKCAKPAKEATGAKKDGVLDEHQRPSALRKRFNQKTAPVEETSSAAGEQNEKENKLSKQGSKKQKYAEGKSFNENSGKETKKTKDKDAALKEHSETKQDRKDKEGKARMKKDTKAEDKKEKDKKGKDKKGDQDKKESSKKENEKKDEGCKATNAQTLKVADKRKTPSDKTKTKAGGSTTTASSDKEQDRGSVWQTPPCRQKLVQSPAHELQPEESADKHVAKMLRKQAKAEAVIGKKVGLGLSADEEDQGSNDGGPPAQDIAGFLKKCVAQVRGEAVKKESREKSDAKSQSIVEHVEKLDKDVAEAAESDEDDEEEQEQEEDEEEQEEEEEEEVDNEEDEQEVCQNSADDDDGADADEGSEDGESSSEEPSNSSSSEEEASEGEGEGEGRVPAASATAAEQQPHDLVAAVGSAEESAKQVRNSSPARLWQTLCGVLFQNRRLFEKQLMFLVFSGEALSAAGTTHKREWDQFCRSACTRNFPMSLAPMYQSSKLDLFSLWLDGSKDWKKVTYEVERTVQSRNLNRKQWQAQKGRTILQDYGGAKGTKILEARKAAGLWYPDPDFPEDSEEPGC